MNTFSIKIFVICALALSISACDSRKATESTGTATATVKTTAPANVVSDSQLQAEAQHAADAASTPANGKAADTTNTAPVTGSTNKSQ
jgi:hypothetical protein